MKNWNENFVKYWSNFVNLVEIWSNFPVPKKTCFWGKKLLRLVWGPHKRHDGGWKCLIIQKNLVKFVRFVKFCQKFDQKILKKRFFFRKFAWKISKTRLFFRKFTKKFQEMAFFQPKFWYFFLQNPVSGPHKRHDGGWNCLIIQQKIVKFCQIWSNLLQKF